MCGSLSFAGGLCKAPGGVDGVFHRVNVAMDSGPALVVDSVLNFWHEAI
jgi:hypothetical protein